MINHRLIRGMYGPGLALMTVIAPAGVAKDGSPGRAVYVSPQGSDHNVGTSIAAPFETLERAQHALVETGISNVYLLGGIYRRSALLTLRTLPQPQHWMAYPGNTPVIDGFGKSKAAIYIAGHHISIEGISIRNYSENGIIMESVNHVEITNNRISNIGSNSWTKAAILGLQVVENVQIKGNYIDNTGYAAIGLFASSEGILKNITISDNKINRTCRNVPDCGAIYLLGRTRDSTGNVVKNNRIVDYGPMGSDARAIYLDDYLSGARVENNRVLGCGRYGIHIHGGHDNFIVGNVIRGGGDQAAVFYQGADDASRGPMTGNVLSRNLISTGRSGGWIAYDSAPVRPRLNANRIRPAITTCRG